MRASEDAPKIRWYPLSQCGAHVEILSLSLLVKQRDSRGAYETLFERQVVVRVAFITSYRTIGFHKRQNAGIIAVHFQAAFQHSDLAH